MKIIMLLCQKKEPLNEQATKEFQKIIDNITDPELLESYKSFFWIELFSKNFSGDIGGTLDAVVQKLGSGDGINTFSLKAQEEAGYDANKIISAALKE